MECSNLLWVSKFVAFEISKFSHTFSEFIRPVDTFHVLSSWWKDILLWKCQYYCKSYFRSLCVRASKLLVSKDWFNVLSAVRGHTTDWQWLYWFVSHACIRVLYTPHNKCDERTNSSTYIVVLANRPRLCLPDICSLRTNESCVMYKLCAAATFHRKYCYRILRSVYLSLLLYACFLYFRLNTDKHRTATKV